MMSEKPKFNKTVCFHCGVNKAVDIARAYQKGKREGAKASLERVVKLMDSIAMGSPEEDLKQYWKLGEKLKKEVNPDD